MAGKSYTFYHAGRTGKLPLVHLLPILILSESPDTAISLPENGVDYTIWKDEAVSWDSQARIRSIKLGIHMSVSSIKRKFSNLKPVPTFDLSSIFRKMYLKTGHSLPVILPERGTRYTMVYTIPSSGEKWKSSSIHYELLMSITGGCGYEWHNFIYTPPFVVI